jgi:hypothetical protein
MLLLYDCMHFFILRRIKVIQPFCKLLGKVTERFYLSKIKAKFMRRVCETYCLSVLLKCFHGLH